MNVRSLFFLSLASTLIAQTALAVPPNATQTFQCIPLKTHQSGARFGTISFKPNGEATLPLLVWKTQEFSDSGYTPERRCYEVTDRLNRAVAQNNGQLGNLWLTMGMVNRLPVVCYVNNTNAGCDRSNVLFTLNKNNSSNPSKVMASLVSFSLGSNTASGRNSAIEETTGIPYVNLGKLVEAASQPAQSSR